VNDKTRREFLKSCFRIGGYAGIACLGMGAVEDARGWGILPVIVGSGAGPGTSWATWDEITESGWGDPVNNYIALFDGSAAQNETGQGGGLSGADLALTQVNNVPAASGSPPTRALTTASTQYFTHTDTAGGIIAANGGAGWSVIIKVNTFAVVGADQYIYWYSVNAAGKLRVLLKKENGSNKLNVGIYDVTAASWKLGPTSTTDIIPATGDVYLCAWYDGTYFRAGFATTKPTKWSDFDATKRLTDTNTSTAVGPTAGIGASELGASPSTVKLYYIILSKTALIDNAS